MAEENILSLQWRTIRSAIRSVGAGGHIDDYGIGKGGQIVWMVARPGWISN